MLSEIISVIYMRSGGILSTFLQTITRRITLTLELLINFRCWVSCSWVILVKCVKRFQIVCGAIGFEKSLYSFAISHDRLMVANARDLQILDFVGCNSEKIVIKVGLYALWLWIKSILGLNIALLENARALSLDWRDSWRWESGQWGQPGRARLMRHIKFIISFILEDHVTVSEQFTYTCADAAILG